MVLTQIRPSQHVPNELEIGRIYLTKDDAVSAVKPGREFAPLSIARTIQKAGWYWINTEGVPTVGGYYRDNRDGTFTKIQKGERIPHWSEQLYVSGKVAKAVRSGNPRVLHINDGSDETYLSRLNVHSDDGVGFEARIATVAIDLRTAALDAIRTH